MTEPTLFARCCMLDKLAGIILQFIVISRKLLLEIGVVIKRVLWNSTIKEHAIERNGCDGELEFDSIANLVCKMLHAGQTCGNNITVYCDIPKTLVRDRGSQLCSFSCECSLEFYNKRTCN
jgi:hypothetical protein